MSDRIAEWARQLQSLAQAGLYYGRDDFDRERYRRIREISAEMMAERTGLPLDTVREVFCREVGYQTPKVDTRAAIFENGKILLVCERSGRWAVPGGWCDYDLSPAENTVKEAREETGLEIELCRLIAVQDKEKHTMLPYGFKVVQIYYLCRAKGGVFVPNIETSDSRFFGEEELPALAEEKSSEEQIRMCFAAYRNDDWAAVFD